MQTQKIKEQTLYKAVKKNKEQDELSFYYVLNKKDLCVADTF